MVYNANKDNFGFATEMSMASANNYMGWISGGDVTPDTGLDIDVSAGEILYQGDNVSTLLTPITLTAHATLKKRVLIVYNGTAVVAIDGVPADDINSTAKPADIDPDTDLVLALITIDAAETTIQTSDIKDYRMRSSEKTLADEITLERTGSTLKIKDSGVSTNQINPLVAFLPPVGSIIAWHKSLLTNNSYEYNTEFTTPSADSDIWYSVHTFSGADLTAAGIPEGAEFKWKTDVLMYIPEVSGGGGRVRLKNGAAVILEQSTSSTSYVTKVTDIVTSWTNATTFALEAFRDKPNLSGGSTKTRNNSWFVNSATLPLEYVECNGQVLSDPESTIDGVTIPDLNGSSGPQRFLRGATSSGITAGTETHNHIGASFNTSGSGGGRGSSDNYSTVTSTSSHLPPYFEIIWIMRVK